MTKLTIAEAKAQGFKIDQNCYPPMAYKGPRFRPDDARDCLTELETILLDALKAAHSHLEWCGYGDSWERECAREEKLEEKIVSALGAAES